MSLFITFEGGEAAGKSTQIRLLHDALTARGSTCLVTREPGGSPAAEAIRHLLLDPALPLAPEAELLLVFAARADHLAATVLPALDRGEIVLCDRFADSTLAYQGYGAGADADRLATIAWLTGRLPRQPDLTLVLEIDAAAAAARLAARYAALGGGPDRFETRDAAFHDRVRAGFAEICRAHPVRCRRITAADTPERVHAEILAAVLTAVAHHAAAPRQS